MYTELLADSEDTTVEERELAKGKETSKLRKFRSFAVLRCARVGIMGVIVTCDGMPCDAALAAASSVVASLWADPHTHAGNVQSHPASAYRAGAAEAGGWNVSPGAPGGYLETRSSRILLWGVGRPHRWQGQRRRSSVRQGPRPLAELPLS